MMIAGLNKVHQDNDDDTYYGEVHAWLKQHACDVPTITAINDGEHKLAKNKICSAKSFLGIPVNFLSRVCRFLKMVSW